MGYVVHLGNKAYPPGKVVEMTDEEYEAQRWKVEPVTKQARAKKTTAVKEDEVKNKAQ